MFSSVEGLWAIAVLGITSLLCAVVGSGETEYNRKQVVQGQLDVPLSSDGLVQADRVATRIARMEGNSRAGFDLIFSSDLSRAKQVKLKYLNALENNFFLYLVV